MRISPCFAVTAMLSVIPFLIPAARASVYRCVGEDGHISYQQIRCYSEDKPMILRGSRSGGSSLRPGEKALLKYYRKKDAARRRKPRAGPEKRVKESTACWSRRKQLEAVRAKLRRGYTLQEGEALHRKRDNHADYLKQFCS